MGALKFAATATVTSAAWAQDAAHRHKPTQTCVIQVEKL